MAVIKFEKPYQDTDDFALQLHPDLLKYWHGISILGSDFTLCGHALSEYEYIAKRSNRVTCPMCAKLINQCKSFKTKI